MSTSTSQKKPQDLSGFDLIQIFFPRQARLFSEEIGILINKIPASIRNDVNKKRFPIPHGKDSAAVSARLWWDVRDVAAYLDAQRSPTKLGRPTKASKMALKGGDHV